ncbi:MAG TPA: YifB family Mg chelatase-like AAA ATPase [Alphaproteobacteria bacterium]|nr:YifB family Mg chelatase-like AAA ATPase [Alphaproteobacteria bacterium]
MISRVATVAFQGVEVLDIDVQVHMGNGMVGFTIVGLPDKAVGESRERVRSALSALGLALPAKRITVNLAPADVLKEGSHYDLPIACGLLAAMGVLPPEELANFCVLGELALDGQISPVTGVLPAAIGAMARGRGLICPQACGGEAAWAGEIEVLAAPSLLSLINHFKGLQILARPEAKAAEDLGRIPDLRDIKGQETAKRAIEIAAAGGHNLLMVGPPGVGKSMLASRLPGLLPELAPAEALEVSMIASVAGVLRDGRITRRRPYRAPHHSASIAAMVGGGTRAKPGEVTLAHRGVLFLDELPEYPRQVLESLRQPIEAGTVTVARAQAHVTYPARFQLVAAMNPCRCGHLADPERACGRAPKCGADYQSRISGPLLDRFDLTLEVAAMSAADLTLPPPAEGTAEVAARVAAARSLARRRYGADGPACNAEADGELLMEVATPDERGRALLGEAVERLRLSARGYHRILRTARTIADLDASPTVTRRHIAEALSYRGGVTRV